MIIIGIIGATILIIAWIFATLKEIKRHKSLIDLRFSVLSLVATILLAIYSYQINNAIFVFINISLSILITIEILYTVHVVKFKK